MSLHLDKSFANLISSRLPLFKWKTYNVANFRCVLCGDSQKNKYKKRGYFYETKDGLAFKCQNCNKCLSFSNFLKNLDPNIHKEYLLEKFKDSNKPVQNYKKQKKKEEKLNYNISSLLSIRQLPETHRAKLYIKNRKIPEQEWDKLFYTENYKKWINENIVKDKFKTIPQKDERIVIPFYDKSQKPFAFSGRSLDADNEPRYIHINETGSTLLYGLDTVDINKTIYLCEGQFDKMFLENGLAAVGSSLKKLIKSELDVVFIFDNEKRSKEIIALMEEIIKHNRKIVIWPKNILTKDINEGILKDIDMMKVIKKNTYQGLTAQLKFQEWRKI